MSMLSSTRLFDRLFTAFPQKAVEYGDSWNQPLLDTTMAPQGLGQVITDGNIKLTYKGVKDTLGKRCWSHRHETPHAWNSTATLCEATSSMDLSGDGTFSGTAYHDTVETGALGGIILRDRQQQSSCTLPVNRNTTVPVKSRIALDIHQPRQQTGSDDHTSSPHTSVGRGLALEHFYSCALRHKLQRRRSKCNESSRFRHSATIPLCFRYHFEQGDTLVYTAESMQTVSTLMQRHHLLKLRREVLVVFCQSVTPEGNYILGFSLFDSKQKQVTA